MGSILVGLGAMVVASVAMYGLSFLICYGYTGHTPIILWPIAASSLFYGCCQGIQAGIKWKKNH